jgi:hypothetical protein
VNLVRLASQVRARFRAVGEVAAVEEPRARFTFRADRAIVRIALP